MDEKTFQQINPNKLPLFSIKVKGHLKREVIEEFKNMMVCYSGGNTHLVGPISDDSFLYSLILRLLSLKCALLSVEPVNSN